MDDRLRDGTRKMGRTMGNGKCEPGDEIPRQVPVAKFRVHQFLRLKCRVQNISQSCDDCFC